MVASPETAATVKAQKAIDVLSGEEPTTRVTPPDGAIVPQQRKKAVERDSEDRRRPISPTPTENHDAR